MKKAILIILFLSSVYSLGAEEKKRPRPKWCNTKAWRKQLKAGLREAQVRAMLGEPKYIRRGSHETVLYYHIKPHIQTKKGNATEIIWPKFGFVVFSDKNSDGEKWEIVEIRQVKKRIKDKREAKENERIRKSQAKERNRAKETGKVLDQRELDKKTRKREKKNLTKPYLRTLEWVEPDWNHLDDMSNISVLGEQAEKPKQSLAKWQDSKSWRRLRLNSTESQIKKILGEPTREQRGVRKYEKTEQQAGQDEAAQIWEYGSGITAGTLEFTFDESILRYRLSKWSEPF